MPGDVSVYGTLLTTLGAIVTGGATGYLAAVVKSKETLKEWRRARSDAVHKLAADLVQETATGIASAGHSACWLTWKAAHDPLRFNQADMDLYDAEMHAALPKILGGAAALATLSPDAARRIEEAASRICAMDAAIGEACVSYRAGDPQPLVESYITALEAHNAATKVCSGVAANLFADERLTSENIVAKHRVESRISPVPDSAGAPMSGIGR